MVPGPNKEGMEKQILEYLCGLMTFEYDSVTESIQKRFDEEVKTLFREKLGVPEE